MRHVILEAPLRRSWKTIGTSSTRSPGAERAPRQLDLEGVALRADARGSIASSVAARKALEAAREVADRDAEDRAGVPASRPGERAAHQVPVLDARPPGT
jgi:hypothetical protein